MKNFLKILLIASFLLPSIAFADAETERTAIIVAVHKLVYIFGFLVGLILVISAGMKMKLASESNGQNSNKGIIYISFLAGVLMMNSSSTLSTYIATLLGSGSGHCFILDSSQSDAKNCWSADSSGLTGQLKTRIEKLSSAGVAATFMKNINIIVGMLQVIGFIYFLVGTYGLVQVSNGSSRDGGYGKPIITMIASALIVDIPHTAEMAVATLEKIGVNF
jgi:hypothetical protein